MISVEQLKKKANTLYFTFLLSYIEGENIFPKSIPSDKKIPDNFAEYRDSISNLIKNSKNSKGYGYSIVFEKVNTKKYGEQDIVKDIIFIDFIDFLKFIGKYKEFENFKKDLFLIRSSFNDMDKWLKVNIKTVIENAGKWENIIKVCQYFKENPQPNLYIRELPINNIDTKFIENNKECLKKILEYLLEDLVNYEYSDFERRFNLKYHQSMIRVRILDQKLIPENYPMLNDLEIPLSIFEQMNFKCQNVFIVENKHSHTNIFNFLTFPQVENSIVIFGSGYKVEIIAKTGWLRNKNIFYWGDIDIHGFDILSKLRHFLPQTISIMMDFATLNSFNKFIVKDDNVFNQLPANLNAEELILFKYISENGLRLEQERINQDYVNNFLNSLINSL